jgi:tripartite motif-containing protein 71
MVSCAGPQRAAQEAPPPPLQYLGEWGTSGTGPGQLENPQAITVDAAGNVFIADARAETEVEKFGPAGEPLLAFDAGGSRDPWDLAIDIGQAIFLVDPRGELVQIFSPEGEHFRSLHLRYRRTFKDPASIAMDYDGNFYLADSGTGRVARMDPRGHLYAAWERPEGLPAEHWAPCRIRLGFGGVLYATDALNQKIVKFSSDGKYIAEWDFPFSPLKAPRDAPKAYGLAVSQNYVAASDEDKHLVGIWTMDGEPKLTVDLSQHPEWGEHATATDVAFTPKGELLILDRGDARVLRFQLNLSAETSNAQTK